MLTIVHLAKWSLSLSVFLILRNPSFLVVEALTMMTTKPYANDDGLMVVIGLNPALQKRFVIKDHEDLVPGNVHRASHVQAGVGGKGQDVAIAWKCLFNEEANFRLVQFLGKGAEGDTVRQILKERLGPDTIETTTLHVQSSLRTCTSIVGGTETTELVEPSGTIQPREIQQLLQQCEKLSSAATIGGVCIMGSMPPGCPSTMYANLYQRLTTMSTTSTTLCVMDSVAGVGPLLQTLVGPTIYKVNRQELCGLVDMPSEEGATTLVEKVIPAFMDKYQPSSYLHGIAITDGKRPGYLCWINKRDKSFRLFSLDVPKLDGASFVSGPLYPIGAGDAVAAGILTAWMAMQGGSTALPTACQTAIRGKQVALQQTMPAIASTLVTAFAFGLACGSASCLQEQNSVLDVEDAIRLFADLSAKQAV